MKMLPIGIQSFVELRNHNTFNNYWFATGTPTFLINTVKTRNQAEMLLQPITVSASSFNSSDPDTMDTEQLLFQTGYLTVKNIEQGEFGTAPQYVLGIPNQEVLDSIPQMMAFAGKEVGCKMKKLN